MRRIAVIGAGVVGINCLLRLIDERDPGEVEIVWIYDSSTPIFGIGETTTPDLPSQISDSTNLSIRHAQKEFDATIKYGNKFIGWGNKHNFVHWLDFHCHGLHFDTSKFSQYFLESLPSNTYDFTLLDQKITDVNITNFGMYLNGERYDFVIDCSGKSLLDPDIYFDAPFPTVNTALTVRIPEAADWDYTITCATKNGWMFGVPLRSRHTWGYCYDSTITSEEEALEDLKTIIKRDDINYRKVQWKQRLSGYLMHPSGKYAKNGNTLGFIDPLEGFAGSYYDQASNKIVEFACRGYMHVEGTHELNDWYYDHVVDDWIKNNAWCYHFGSMYDTPFWRRTKSVCTQYLNDPDVYEINKSESFTDELWQRISYDDDLKRKAVIGELEEAIGGLHSFVSNYRHFVEMTYGMGAEYAERYPITSPMVVCPEPHGELSQEI